MIRPRTPTRVRSFKPVDPHERLYALVLGALRGVLADLATRMLSRGGALLTRTLASGNDPYEPIRARVTSDQKPEPLASPGIVALVYELLDAHDDIARLASGLASDPVWLKHLDYVRRLQRQGREALALASSDDDR